MSCSIIQISKQSSNKNLINYPLNKSTIKCVTPCFTCNTSGKPFLGITRLPPELSQSTEHRKLAHEHMATQGMETLRKCQSSLVLSPVPPEILQTWYRIMKRAVAKCPSVNIKMMGEDMPSLLDSGSTVSFMWQMYFNRYFSPQLGTVDGWHTVYLIWKVPMVGACHCPGISSWTLNF